MRSGAPVREPADDPFELAPFFDQTRWSPIRIGLPVDVSISGRASFPKMSPS